MSYPVILTIDHPDKLSRGLLILKILFGWLYVGIPHGIILGFYSFAVSIVTFIAFWAILFAGKYPRGMYNFVVGYMRWTNNVAAYYSYLLRDEYPPFTGDQTSYPVVLDVEYPERLSRGLLILKVLFGWIYVGIPHGIILGFYGIIVGIITFIAFWAILFTGRYPIGMYNLVVGYIRWYVNVNTYMFLLRDEYPPFGD
jgi:hypothetical protein